MALHAEIVELMGSVPEVARDLRLNLDRLLADGELDPSVRWGVAVASAASARQPALEAALVAGAIEAVGPAVVEDALAAAALMGMTNIYYRSRHMTGDAEYDRLPAGLRMSRLARPSTDQVTLELMSLAASAVNGCEYCVRAHEKVVREAGITREAVNAVLRIAATVHGLAVTLANREAAAMLTQEVSDAAA